MQVALGVEYKDLFAFDKTVKKNPLKAFILKFNDLNDTDAKYFLANIDAYLKAKKENSEG